MAEFLDNQEVTTAMLNNIAVDLGATSFGGFGSNKFGVDALNDITAAIISKGVTQSANKCKPYISGDDLYISAGTIVFTSGAKIRLEAPTKVEKQASTYVYALNDTSHNTASITVSESEPTVGDLVHLAHVTADGELVDRREFATARVALTAPAAIYSETRTDRIGSSEAIELFTLDNGQGYTMCMIEYADMTSFAVLTNGEAVEISDSKMDDYVHFYVTKNGTKCTVSARLNGSGASDVSYKIYFA